jgi:signal transduction histidine kinase
MSRRLPLPLTDVLIAGAIAVVAVVEVVVNARLEPKGPALVTELVAAASVAWRRRAPLATVVVASVCGVAEAVAGVPLVEPITPLLVMVVAVYSLGLYGSRRQVGIGFAAVVAAITIQVLDQHKGVGNFIFGLVFSGGALFVGRAMQGRVDETRRIAQRAERERQLAVEEERSRIARELHDVIAHSVSVMTVQAGAAEAMLAVDPAQALEPVRAVQETGRQALVEMKRLVGMLREADEEIGLAPQPRVAELDTLVAQVAEAGLPVFVSITGAARPLPLGVDLSAYRIVQEALTNALKHAGASRADVTLRYGARELELEISDDGRGSAATTDGSGHGLVGMRERAAVFGGSLEAGARDGGGFRVHALLPFEGVA